MIQVRPAAERGQTRTSWLDSRHTFSFNRYYDPRYTGFRDLLVVNAVGDGKAFEVDHNDGWLLSADGSETALAHGSKALMASRVLDALRPLLAQVERT